MSKFSVLTIVLLLVAVALRSEVAGMVAIALGTAVLLSRFWIRSIERGLHIERTIPQTIAFGDEMTIHTTITNRSLLRVPWIEARDSVALGLRRAAPPHTVFTLGPGGQHTLSYVVRGTRRGWFSVGPLSIRSGDVLGLARIRLNVAPQYVTVLPRVVPLATLGLPALLNFGPLQPLGLRRRTEDPARPAGVRQYVPGDDVRRLDWKSSARQSALLVRRAEPTIAPETMLMLAFGRADYPAQIVQDALERAATVAASLGVALLSRKLPVGLITNGYDPMRDLHSLALDLAKGDGQRQLLLATLGRLSVGGEVSLFNLIRQHQLPWGGTAVLIMADLTIDVLPEVLALRRRGQQIVLMLVEASTQGLLLAQQQQLTAYRVDPRGVPVPERSM